MGFHHVLLLLVSCWGLGDGSMPAVKPFAGGGGGGGTRRDMYYQICCFLIEPPQC